LAAGAAGGVLVNHPGVPNVLDAAMSAAMRARPRHNRFSHSA
jgi:hypothetical protein